MTALAIYRALLKRGTAPALTLYGPSAGAPRLELSGAVVANHAAKAANFLADDIMIDPGQDLKLDLPSHWRLLTWALGGLLAGAHISPDGDVVVTDNPDADGDDVIVVSLGALDFSWPGDLPGTVIDGNAEVLGQADLLLDEASGAESNAADLAAEVVAGGDRLLLVDPSPTELLRVFLGAMMEGKSLVITDAENYEKAAAAEGAELYSG